MGIWGRRLDPDKLAELGRRAAKDDAKTKLAKFATPGREIRSYIIRVHTSDGRSAQAWGGLATERNVYKMAEKLAVESTGALVRDVRKVWNLALDDNAHITEVTVETGPDLTAG